MIQKTFRELCDGKVWRAIEAMITGLKENTDRKDFKIDMISFSDISDNVCFGCAATCAIQKLSGIQLTPETYSNWIKENNRNFDFVSFENAIDSLRRRNVTTLFAYMDRRWRDYEKIPTHLLTNLRVLQTDTWHNDLYSYEALLNYLKQHDI